MFRHRELTSCKTAITSGLSVVANEGKTMNYFLFVVWTLAVGGICYFNGYYNGRASGIDWASVRIYGPRS